MRKAKKREGKEKEKGEKREKKIQILDPFSCIRPTIYECCLKSEALMIQCCIVTVSYYYSLQYALPDNLGVDS